MNKSRSCFSGAERFSVATRDRPFELDVGRLPFWAVAGLLLLLLLPPLSSSLPHPSTINK
jgi:hypothetical protein